MYFSVLAGCGTMGAFFFQNCSGCDKEGCEDEGACVWREGECQEMGGYRKNRKGPRKIINNTKLFINQLSNNSFDLFAIYLLEYISVSLGC